MTTACGADLAICAQSVHKSTVLFTISSKMASSVRSLTMSTATEMSLGVSTSGSDVAFKTIAATSSGESSCDKRIRSMYHYYA